MERVDAVSCLHRHNSFGFHSARLRLLNHYTQSTHNTEGAMDKNPSHCESVCVSRYDTVWAGGGGLIFIWYTACWSARGPFVSSTVLVFSRNGTLNPRPSFRLWQHSACLRTCTNVCICVPDFKCCTHDVLQKCIMVHASKNCPSEKIFSVLLPSGENVKSSLRRVLLRLCWFEFE